MHRAILVTTLMLLSAVAWIGNGMPASATGNCAGITQSNYFAGYVGYVRPPASWNESPEGTSGFIVTRDGPVCPDIPYGYTFSAAWVMLQDQAPHHYAQGGFMFDGTCERYFTEWNVGSGFHRTLNQGICSAYGSQHPYYVLYNGPAGPYPPCCGSLSITTPGIFLNTGIDPWQQGWAMTPTYAGEVDHLVNDVPGAAWAWTDMPGMGIQSVDTGALRPTPCYLSVVHNSVPTPRYHQNASGCDHSWVWTDPF